MPPLPNLDPSVGGVLQMEYGPTGLDLAHPVHLAVAQFDPTPQGGNGDYLYTRAGPVIPQESGVLATFSAFGDVWQRYYPAEWSLRLVRVWQNVGGFASPGLPTPTAPSFAGTNSATFGPEPVVKRIISLFSELGARWRIFLRQLPPTAVGVRVDVTANTGGIDANDQALIGYLSGAATGVVSRDGTRFQIGARVYTWWDAPIPGAIVQDSTGFVVSG
jgi:hypothetical protein